MILIGTDGGIYRWFEGSPWPIYHGLQDRGVRLLAAAPGGLLAAVDAAGRVVETSKNGLSWREVPRPEGSGRPTALALLGAPAALVLATARPLALYRRAPGSPARRSGSPADPIGAILGRVRALASRRGGAAVATAKAPEPELFGWTRLGVPAVSPAPGVAPEIRALVADPARPDTWFAAIAGAGLWTTPDAGASWSRCEGLPGEVFAVRAAEGSPGRLAVGTSDGVRVSLDGGQTWEDRGTGLGSARYVRALELKPGEPDVMLAGAAPGAADPEAAGALNFKLFETTDGGKTWSHLKRGAPEDLEYDPIVDIRFDPDAPRNIVVAAESGEMTVSRNGGEYWSPLARQLSGARAIAAVR